MQKENFNERDVRKLNHLPLSVRVAIEADNPSIVRWEEKCIRCGMCKEACTNLMGVHGTYTLEETGGKAICIYCGQCANVCPVDSITERDETAAVQKAIADPGKVVVVSTSPSVRAALGEEFGMEPGAFVEGKMVALLRALGADYVLDTNFAADLTIVEEASELIRRITEKDRPLPQFTSCCPGWVHFAEIYAPELLPHLSTAKSPIGMQGPTVKTYFAQNAGLDPKKIFSVSIMPCTAKKQEIKRSEDMFSSGCQDNDLVLTTRELARLFKQFGIDFKNIEPQEADSPIGQYTGAATIFGVTGGVMEAALRTAYYLVTKEELSEKAVDFTCVRGMEGIKKATVDVKGTPVRVAVAHGLKNVQTLLQEVRDARENGKELPYHFIEVMACKGGCIAGGGQPYGTEDEIRAKRINGLYADDKKCEFRKSHQNPDIQKIYKDFFGEPSSHKAHKLLHTHYVSRPTYKK